MNRKDQAIVYHDMKYNCCQSTVMAFAEDLPMDKELLFKACECFGFGMGGAQCTCGALSGAIMLAGLKNSDGDLNDPKTKAMTYKIGKEMTEKFLERVGALSCKDIKGLESGKMLTSCPDCIQIAVEIAEEVLGIEPKN